MIAKKRVMAISKLLSMIVISTLITFFSMSQIRAYYQDTKSTTIGFTTEPYSNLTFSLDKTTYPSGNNSATVKLTVNNPNAYNVTYQLSFSNTNCTYTIDGAAATTYTVNASSSKTNTIVISGATETSITITIAAKTPYSATHTKVVNFDNSNPTVSVTTTNNVAASQTATLKCTDTVGVTAYYWGTTEPTSASAITTTTSADLTALASTSGLSKTVSSAGTYWLGCRDAAGNFSKASIVYQKLTLTMTNGTVSPTSVVAKNGNTIALPTPTATSGYTNDGSWYSSNAYTTSVGVYGANYTVSSTTTIYSRATDVTAPTVSDIGGGTTLKATSQSLTLKCTDTVGVTAYYWGTTEPTAASAITTTTSADLTALASTSGLSKSVTAAGTYWLACKDAAGNFAKKSIVIRKYQVQTVLETIAGATGTYTSANYETSGSAATYYVKNGTTLTLSSIYTIPTGAASGTFKGYTTSAPSTTAQTPSTTNPTVATNNTTVYYMWFNRNTYTITVNSGENGSTKIEAVTKGTNVTASAGESKTMSVKYGDTVKATATPATGYNFTGWSGGYISGSTNPTTGAAVTAAETITSTFADNIAPVCTWGTWSESEIYYGSVSTITLTCTDSGTGVSTTSLTSSNFTFSNSSAYTISVTSGGTSASRTFIVTATGLSDGGSGTVTLKASQVKDGANNENAAKTSPSLTVLADTTGPEIEFGTNGNTTYAKSQSTIVTVTDPSGVSTRKYLWTQTAGANASSGTSFTSGNNITKNTGDGIWYLCIYATDTLGNSSNECSNAFYLDNTAPTIVANNFCILKGSGTVATAGYAAATDANSVTITASPSTINRATLGSTTVTFTATDGAGNTATATATANVYTKIYSDGVVTTGDGLYNDAYTSGRYVFRGGNPSNYITFNGETWRIVAIEANGTYKLVRNSALSSKMAFASSKSTLFANSSLKTYLNTNSSGNYYYDLTATAKSQMVSTTFYAGTIGTVASGDSMSANISTDRSSTFTGNVGLISVGDYAYASTDSNCTNFYRLYNKVSSAYKCNNNNYLYKSSGDWFWVINIHSNGNARLFGTGSDGVLKNQPPTYSYAVYPSVHLKETTTFQGAGTSSSPYTICSSCNESGFSPATCSISVSNASTYETSKTLTISVTLNGATLATNGYSWNNSTWGSTNNQSISQAGTYTAYIKDTDGKTNKCSVTIKSREEYQHSTCTSCGSCYYCSSGTKYVVANFAYCCVGRQSAYTNQYDCEDAYYWWSTGLSRCCTSGGAASYGSNTCGHCGCNSWNTSDTTWYTNSCGTSNYSTCKNRNTRTTYGT